MSKLACEFYAHITLPDNSFIYVRGVSTLFDEDCISAKFWLSVVQDEHSGFAATITLDGLNQVLKDLFVEGT